MQHLLEFFDRYVTGAREALRFDDGFRCRSYTFDQLRDTARAFGARLAAAGLRPGDRCIVWSENRPEWLVVFWGCMLRGVVLIPVDAKAAPDLVRRIVDIATPAAIVAGEHVSLDALSAVPLRWRLREIAWAEPRRTTAAAGPGSGAHDPARADVSASTTAEIVFTSGTTGDPKGVLISHGNILANIGPIERAAIRYRRYIRFLRPLRFLGLVPLGHMFGQAMSVFFPPLVAATTVFVEDYGPREIVTHARRHRITLAVMVPRMLDLLGQHLRRTLPTCGEPSAEPSSWPRRAWRYRDAHRLLGWRFRAFVVGGASLDRALEEFWHRLGFPVIQGYGLTETAPLVAWNDPFRIERGSVGVPLEGVELRVAPDGEVLVRGPSVTAGYLEAAGHTRVASEDGWFHTGDLGTLDATGHLRILGRKKDVIVTPEGLHVVPDDVERSLDAVPGVREAAVVGHRDRVHAVLVLEPDVDGAAVVRQVNPMLLSEQKIMGFSVWPGRSLPRTEATRKLKREEIRRWVAAGAPRETMPGPAVTDEVTRALAPYAHGHPVGADTKLDELGLSSLDRLELALTIGSEAGIGLSDEAVAGSRTVGDLRRALADAASTAPPAEGPLTFPRWARRAWARAVRKVGQAVLIRPLTRLVVSLDVTGREHLAGLRGPVIFAANHQSLLDTPVILTSLPSQWRRHVAVAMGTGFFDAYFTPAGHRRLERLTFGALYHGAALFFHGFPLPEHGTSARATLRYAGELATDGTSILIFPEGRRTDRGEIHPFQPGVAMMAARLGLPVVPVRLVGLDRVMHRTWRWPKRGAAHVSFGRPRNCTTSDYVTFAAQLQEAVTTEHPREVVT